MDAKSIKSHLKEAKEAIKNKEIEKALKLCKVSRRKFTFSTKTPTFCILDLRYFDHVMFV